MSKFQKQLVANAVRAKATEAQLMGFTLDDAGHCIKCGSEAYGVEPDAEWYRCENCGTDAVFGLQTLLFMDLVDIVDVED